VPRCGALSLLQKPLHYRGDSAETAATQNAKFGSRCRRRCAWRAKGLGTEQLKEPGGGADGIAEDAEEIPGRPMFSAGAERN
jgi:hypothetical protein